MFVRGNGVGMMEHLKAACGVVVIFLLQWAAQMIWLHADPRLLLFFAFLVSLLWLAIHYRERIAGYSRRYRWGGCVVLALMLGAAIWWTLTPKTGLACLRNHISQISLAIEEKDTVHLYDELKVLYPRLEECGLQAPILEPRQIGNAEYDRTW